MLYDLLKDRLHGMINNLQQKAARRRRKLAFVTKQRDGLKKILDSYDEDEDSFNDSTKQHLERIKELEDALENSNNFNKELEIKLSEAEENLKQSNLQLDFVGKDN